MEGAFPGAPDPRFTENVPATGFRSPRNLQAPAAIDPNETEVTCAHCGWTTSMRPPYLHNVRPTRPVRFAMKCLSDVGPNAQCLRIRVFSYLELDHSRLVLSEVAPILPLYAFIQEMSEYTGSRKKIADFLVAACDLHMFGLLETDPQSRDAAFAGSAIHLRKAAELFLRRIILQERQHPLPRKPIGDLLKKVASSPPQTLRTDARPFKVKRLLQFVFDVGDVAAHPEVSNRRLRRLKYKLPATPGNIEHALSNFGQVASMVKWK